MPLFGLNIKNPAAQAAAWVWMSGAALLLVMGCCVSALTIAATTPLEKLAETAGTAVSAEHLRQLEQVQPLLQPLAIGVFVIGFFPGLIYLFTGFGIQAGKQGSLRLTHGLLLAQLGLLAMVFVLNLLGLLIQRDLAGLLISMLIYLPLLALLYTTRKHLNRLRRAADTLPEISSDPWSQP